ncbi:uncharacterized protein [Equus przewalskii]|uniref:Uncharacterized protein isoform X4 n=1 Tax=Equus przewalskii TaxID=9798 RepID=A0ABM4JGA3_EQUPR
MHVCICANGKKYTSRILKRTDIKLRWSVHDGPCVSPGAERPTSSHAPLGRHRTTDSISQDAIHPVPGRLQSRGAQSPLGGEVPGRPRASWRKRGPKCLWLLCIGGGRASGGALWLCEQTAAKPLATINQPSVSVLDISCKWDHTIGLPDSKPDAISKLEQWEDPWTVERDAPRGPGQEGAVYNQQERVDLRHPQGVHTEEGTLACGGWEDAFGKNTSFLSSQRIPDRWKLYVCEECGKAFG